MKRSGKQRILLLKLSILNFENIVHLHLDDCPLFHKENIEPRKAIMDFLLD